LSNTLEFDAFFIYTCEYGLHMMQKIRIALGGFDERRNYAKGKAMDGSSL